MGNLESALGEEGELGDVHQALVHAMRDLLKDQEDSSNVTPEQREHGWDPDDCSDNMNVLSDGVTARRGDQSNRTDGVRGKKGYRTGTHEFEIHCAAKERGSHAMIGVATPEAPLGCVGYSNLLGTTNDSWGWNLVDLNLVHGGKVIKKYPSKRGYKVPDTFYAILDANNGTLSFKANNEDLGIAFSNLPHQDLFRPLCIAACASRDECDIRMKYMGSGGKIVQVTEAGEEVVSVPPPSGTSYYTFHQRCGNTVDVMHGGRVAKRQDARNEFHNAVVLTRQPLKTDELFEIRLDSKIGRWSGSIEIGFTDNSPERFEFPSTMTECDTGVNIMWSGTNLVKNGKKILELEKDLDDCTVGDTIGIVRRADKSFHLYFNGEVLQKAVKLKNSPAVVYGVVDIYGQAEGVTICGNDSLTPVPTSPRVARPTTAKAVASGNDPNSIMFRMRETVDLMRKGSDEDIRTVIVAILQTVYQPYNDTNNQQLRRRFGDHLASIGMAAELKKLLDRLNDIGIETESAWLGMNIVRSICWNYADASLKFCKHLGDCGLLGMMLDNLDEYGPRKTENEKRRFMVMSALSILHNCSKATENEQVYRKLCAIDRISPFLKSEDMELAMIALLTISYVVQEDRATLLVAGDEIISHTVSLLENALQDPDLHGHSDSSRYSALELVMGLEKIAANDRNKVTIVNAGAVPILVDLMKLDRPAEQEAAANAIWVLAKHIKCKDDIKAIASVVPTLESCKKSKHSAVSEAAERALMQLKAGQVIPGGRFSSRCEYRQLCERFKKSLNLNDHFFNDRFDMCYCNSCHSARGDKLSYSRGNPPKVYCVPIGWCRFSLSVPPTADAHDVFNQWHVAFHGTTVDAVKPILDIGQLLLPGDILLGGKKLSEAQGHFSDDWKPTGFDTKQVFLSPSIRYSGCDVYAKKASFKDPKTKRNYNARVVIQVSIKPGSYKIGRETIGVTSRIDQHFDNQEIEWSTKQRGSIIMYGLLVKLE